MNILYISPNFNFSCGVSKYVFSLLEHYSKQTEYKIYFITNGGDAISKLNSIGVQPFIMKFNQGLANIKYIYSNLKELQRFCKENQIHIIHTHHRYPELLSVLIARKLDIKTITTAHSIVEGHKLLSFKSDKIIAVSYAVKGNIVNSFHRPEKKITTIYNNLIPWQRPGGEQIELLKRDLNINEEDFVILFLGRINKFKGIDILINAFRKIKIDYPQIKLIVIGDILDRTYPKLNIGNEEDIIHIEAKEDITSFYEICDLVVLPSRQESFPYVMLEAGYVKKLLIASRTGGIAEFIVDGVNGVLFENGNYLDLADKIRYVINNPEYARSVTEEMCKKVKKYCNFEEYLMRVGGIYKELLET